MLKQALVQEYDALWQEADRWDTPARDVLVCNIIRSHIKEPESILDVGCGNGRTMKRLLTAFPRASLYGLDISGEAIKIAKQRVPGALFFQAFVEDFRLSFHIEVVTCLGTAEHFTDLEQGLDKMRRLLYPGGLCYLEVPNCLAYSPGVHGYRRVEFGNHQMEWHLDRQEWEDVISLAGFEIRSRYIGSSETYEFIWMLRNAKADQ